VINAQSIKVSPQRLECPLVALSRTAVLVVRISARILKRHLSFSQCFGSALNYNADLDPALKINTDTDPDHKLFVIKIKHIKPFLYQL
jgi:hypothetical protein